MHFQKPLVWRCHNVNRRNNKQNSRSGGYRNKLEGLGFSCFDISYFVAKKVDLMKNENFLFYLLIFLSLIVLPTLTPEDFITTIPIINLIGVEKYIGLCLILISLLILAKKS